MQVRVMQYIIKYTWPSGKIRYRKGARLCEKPEDADVFTLVEAHELVQKHKTTRIIWDIVTTKERIK